ncbi:hypothetical protein EIB72_26145 [Burkholderia ambifaria]|jgi:hypothetical protein|uniref:hypothetical protein n=1 Tax=Burkholderia ambifaria TaxID=152480 RepID=UPI0013FDC9B8|nr:hypothetical protein [Burkholderia ambifaria]MBR8225853.1 hypothetical protein [Burkholderia ambifaria]NHL69864.1 hypothetical protein [Burkholderia ambifaria]
MDVKVVVDSGDLENIEFVRGELKIDCDTGPRKLVRDREGGIKGYGVDVKCIALSKEYDGERNLYYGLFWPVGVDFYRAGLSIPINGKVICVTSYDLFEVFGGVDKYPVSHWNSWSYVYKRDDINSRVIFSIDRDGCVGGIYISVNRDRQ